MQVRVLLPADRRGRNARRSPGSCCFREANTVFRADRPFHCRRKSHARCRPVAAHQGADGCLGRTASGLRCLRDAPEEQGQLSAHLPNPLRGCATSKHTAASVSLPDRNRTGCQLAATGALARSRCPKRQYLESRWASLLPYAAAAGLCLPMSCP